MRLTPIKKRAIRQLVVLDYLAALLAWCFFWIYRQHVLFKAGITDTLQVFHPIDYLYGIVIIPAGWLFLYHLSGTYFDLYRKSRLNEINRTLISCIIGCVVVSLTVFANDEKDYSYFISMTGHYLLIQTAFTMAFRLFIFSVVKRNLVKGKVGFKTLIIGGNQQAINVYKQVVDNPKVLGNIFAGFIYSSKEASNGMSKLLPQLGHLGELENIIDQYSIEEVIIAVDSSEHHLLENIITRLCYRPVVVKVLPDFYDILSGSVKTSNVYDAVLIHIHPDLMPDWQRVCKRMIDIVSSCYCIGAAVPIAFIFCIKGMRLFIQRPNYLQAGAYRHFRSPVLHLQVPLYVPGG